MKNRPGKIRVMFMGSSIAGGGAERVLLNILNSLPPRKYDLFLGVTNDADVAKLGLAPSVQVSTYRKDHARNAIPLMLRDIRRFKPHYIFTSHFTIAYLFPFIKLIFGNSFKVVVRIAVSPSDYPLNTVKKRIVKFISRFALRGADLLIAQTQSMKEDVVAHLGMNEDRVVVVRNVVDCKFLESRAGEQSDFSFDPACYNIVAAGALYSVKGYDLLIRAMVGVRRQIPNVRLFILGEERYEKGYRDMLNALIEELGLRDCVSLLGFKDNPYPYFRAADLFVMSSRKEAFPNVVLECLSLGTMVVATDCVDFSGVIQDGGNGYIVKTGSVPSIEDGILRAHRNLKKPVVYSPENFDYQTIFA